MSDQKLVGNVSVDSGTVMLVDPCYVLRDERHANYPSMSQGKTYQSFLEAASAKDADLGAKPVSPWGDGLGLVVGTTYGDGGYPVYATYNDAGRITSLTVYFDDDPNHSYDEDDETGWDDDDS